MNKAMIAALSALWDLALRIPALSAADGPFVQHCRNLEDKIAILQDERDILRMPEGACEQLMTTLSHLAAACHACGSATPACIDRPFKAVAHILDRPAQLDVAELVLCNWDF